MRTALTIPLILSALISAATAQTSSSQPVDTGHPALGPAQAPEVGGPLDPARQTGLAKVAPDGVSTAMVPAVRCSVAARETDGTTTCIGIQSAVRHARPAGHDTTTGMVR